MQVNTGDTALVLISAALVMLMTPGLAFFYGGLVRRKNGRTNCRRKNGDENLSVTFHIASIFSNGR